MKSPLLERESFSMSQSILEGSGIIAEFKRRSPSKQVINHKDSVIEVVSGYEKAGASGISVLTDTKYFGGSLDDLIQAFERCAVAFLADQQCTSLFAIALGIPDKRICVLRR